MSGNRFSKKTKKRAYGNSNSKKKLPTKGERVKVGKAADARYASLRERLERDHWGEYICINVDNGDYAIAPDDFEMAQAIKNKYPGIIPFTMRIGYKAVVRRK